MKKLFSLVFFSTVAVAYADFSIQLDAGRLRINASAPLSHIDNTSPSNGGSLLLVIAANGDGGFDNSIASGHYVAGNDLVLAAGGFSTSGGTDETITFFYVSTNNLTLPANDRIALRWFPQITFQDYKNGVTPSTGQTFGTYNPRTSNPPNANDDPDGGDPWLVPPGGSINLNFFTTGSDLGGTQSPGEGYAQFVIGTGPSPTPTPPPTATPTLTPTATPTPTPPTTPTPTPTPTVTPPNPACNLTEGFDVITTLVSGGWVMRNNSSPVGTTGWFQGNSAVFPSQSGAPNSYIAVDFNTGADTSTLSNWLLTPPVILQNGAQLVFWTRTTHGTFPDRLQVRMSTNGSSSNVGTTATSVGDFGTIPEGGTGNGALLLDINPTYTTTGYPTVWTNFTVTISGLGLPITGRLAFRYFVESGGSASENSDYVGIDAVQYSCNGGLPTPTPTPTPTPNPTPTVTPPPPVCNMTEGFDTITTLVSGGWVMRNNSSPVGTTGWFQGNSAVFPSQSGAPDSYITADFNNTTGTNTISNWLLTPPVTLQNGTKVAFWTRTRNGTFPDRLQVRMSTNGTSSNVGTTATSVGDFTTLLLNINPTYTTTGYPTVWTNFTVTVSGLGGPAQGRVAFRYFVESGGPLGVNSDYIGIDSVQYACNGELPSPTPTPTPTPTPCTVTLSGTVRYCPNPANPPMPGVTMTLTGSASGTTATDANGNYSFSSLPCGGSYTVTPTKAALTPGSAGINTVDVLAVQRHFLTVGPLPPGCRLAAADVNGNTAINTVDVVAIQRFFLGQGSGTANVGKYQLTPASRSYGGLTSNQTAQNYDALVFGDVATSFVQRPEGPSQDAGAGEDDMGASEIPATVATLSLPNVAVDASVIDFIAQVTATAIDAKDKLAGFQGDFTFDERVVTFQSEPVRNAGLTAGDWNVSGNVLPVLAGAGPIRTLRISAYSNDFTPLSGTGTLFELRMTRVSKAAQRTQLLWAVPPDHFIFIDADLNTQKPVYAASGGVTSSGAAPLKPATRKPTASPTIAPSDGIDANRTDGNSEGFREQGEVLFSLLPRTMPRETWQRVPLD